MFDQIPVDRQFNWAVRAGLLAASGHGSRCPWMRTVTLGPGERGCMRCRGVEPAGSDGWMAGVGLAREKLQRLVQRADDRLQDFEQSPGMDHTVVAVTGRKLRPGTVGVVVGRMRGDRPSRQRWVVGLEDTSLVVVAGAHLRVLSPFVDRLRAVRDEAVTNLPAWLAELDCLAALPPEGISVALQLLDSGFLATPTELATAATAVAVPAG